MFGFFLCFVVREIQRREIAENSMRSDVISQVSHLKQCILAQICNSGTIRRRKKASIVSCSVCSCSFILSTKITQNRTLATDSFLHKLRVEHMQFMKITMIWAIQLLLRTERLPYHRPILAYFSRNCVFFIIPRRFSHQAHCLTKTKLH